MVARLFLFVTALFAAAAPLHAADWLRAESEHYVVHADLDEAELRALVQRMEDFTKLLENRLPGSTRLARKPQIFLEQDRRTIARVAGRNMAGRSFQNPEISGSYSTYDSAADPMVRDHSIQFALASLYGDNAFIRPNPPWVRVGFPLTFATVFRTEEGAFVIGAPDTRQGKPASLPQARLEWLLGTPSIPQSDGDYGRYYDASGAAARALLTDPQHSGLLEAYIDAFAEGRNMDEAAPLLGDPAELAEAINAFQFQRRPVLTQVTLTGLAPASITVRPMTDAEIDLVQPRMQRAISTDLKDIASRLERLTGRHPDSAQVWYEYAAAEFARVRDADFGGEPVFRGFGFSSGELIVSANPYSDATAWAAVNRALELDPALAEAIVLKAEIQLSRLARAPEPAGMDEYSAVRDALAPLAADPEVHPLAAAVVHQSWIEQGETAPADAVEALGRAFVANAGVEEFRYAYAVALARAGQRDVARRLLTSMLNHPKFRDAAQRALEVEAR